MRISDWSSDVCSSDLVQGTAALHEGAFRQPRLPTGGGGICPPGTKRRGDQVQALAAVGRSEDHTSKLQSLMRISYAGFCLKKKIRTGSEYRCRDRKSKRRHSSN